MYTVIENMAQTSKNGGGSDIAHELLADDEEEDRPGASVENQLGKEMAVYEVYEIKFFVKFER